MGKVQTTVHSDCLVDCIDGNDDDDDDDDVAKYIWSWTVSHAGLYWIQVL